MLVAVWMSNWIFVTGIDENLAKNNENLSLTAPTIRGANESGTRGVLDDREGDGGD